MTGAERLRARRLVTKGLGPWFESLSSADERIAVAVNGVLWVSGFLDFGEPSLMGDMILSWIECGDMVFISVPMVLWSVRSTTSQEDKSSIFDASDVPFPVLRALDLKNGSMMVTAMLESSESWS